METLLSKYPLFLRVLSSMYFRNIKKMCKNISKCILNVFILIQDIKKEIIFHAFFDLFVYLFNCVFLNINGENVGCFLLEDDRSRKAYKEQWYFVPNFNC